MSERNAMVELGRVAVRDKWGDGCTRACVRERNIQPNWRCTCERIAALVVDALKEESPADERDGAVAAIAARSEPPSVG